MMIVVVIFQLRDVVKVVILEVIVVIEIFVLLLGWHFDSTLQGFLLLGLGGGLLLLWWLWFAELSFVQLGQQV